MLNYMAAEFDKILKRKYFWVSMMVVLLLALSGCWAFTYINHMRTNVVPLALEDFIDVGTSLAPSVIYLLIIFVDMITIEEFKFNTIKNIASSGLSRVKIYISKNIEIIVTAIIGTAINTVGSLGLGYVILGVQNPEIVIGNLKLLGISLANYVFLWMGALSILHFIATFLKNGTAACLIYIALFMLLGTMLGALGAYVSPIFNTLNDMWLGTQISTVSHVGDPLETLLQSIMMGMGYTVGFGALGAFLFKRADV